MKCPECGRNQKKSVSMTCGGCEYRFVLRPDVDGLSDGLLLAGVRKASSSDTQYFTLHQLYAAIYNLKRPGPRGMIVSGVILLAGVAAALITGEAFFGVVAFTGLVALLIVYLRRRRQQVQSFADFQSTLHRARGAMVGKFDKLLDKPTLRQPPPDWPEMDIYDYGVQRVLFVEREILVDLFVKNGWHAENNALVISVDGYPSYLKARVQDLLAENPEMPVYLMHDATSDVGVLSERIRADFRLGDREVQDLGLKPEDAERFQGLRRASGQEHVPLDLVPYGALAAATGAAVLTGVLLADALQDQASTGVFASGAYTGYG